MNFRYAMLAALLLAGVTLPFYGEAGRETGDGGRHEYGTHRHYKETGLPVLPGLPKFPSWLDYRHKRDAWVRLKPDEERELSDLAQNPPEVLITHYEPSDNRCSVIYWDENGKLFAIPFGYVDGIEYETYIIKSLLLAAPDSESQYWLAEGLQTNPGIYHQFDLIAQNYHHSPRVLFKGGDGRVGCLYLSGDRLIIEVNNYEKPPHQVLDRYRPGIFRHVEHRSGAALPCFMMTSKTCDYLKSRTQRRRDFSAERELSDPSHSPNCDEFNGSRAQRLVTISSPKRLQHRPFHSPDGRIIKTHPHKSSTSHRRSLSEGMQQTLYQADIQRLVEAGRSLRYQYPVDISAVIGSRPGHYQKGIEDMMKQLQALTSFIHRKRLYQETGCHEARQKLCWHVVELLDLLADERCQRYQQCIVLCRRALPVVSNCHWEEADAIDRINRSLRCALTERVLRTVERGLVHSHQDKSLSKQLMELFQQVIEWNIELYHNAGFSLVHCLQDQWLKSKEHSKLGEVAACAFALPSEPSMSQEQQMKLQLQRWQAEALIATEDIWQSTDSYRVDQLVESMQKTWGVSVLEQYQDILQKVDRRRPLNFPDDRWRQYGDRCIECIKAINRIQRFFYIRASRIQGAVSTGNMTDSDQYNHSLVYCFRVWHAVIAGQAYHESLYEEIEESAGQWYELAGQCRPVAAMAEISQSLQDDLSRARNKRIMHQLQGYTRLKEQIKGTDQAKQALACVDSIWEQYGVVLHTLNSQTRKNLASVGVYSAIMLEQPRYALTQLERIAGFDCSEHLQQFQLLATTIVQHYGRVNEFRHAVESAEQGMLLFGECDELLGWKARALNNQNFFDDCLEWGQSIPHHRSSPALLCEMGVAAFSLKDIVLSYDLMKRVVECNPRDSMIKATAHYYLAKIYYELGCNVAERKINPDIWRGRDKADLWSRAREYCSSAAGHSALERRAYILLREIDSACR
ncbi:hypothetical protein ACWJJH_01935 [Endozoicomonadaceae bacterium StTr2]